MSEIDDGSEDAGRLRDALELRPDEVDAETRERHLARALEAFDDEPARVVPLRRRRLVSVAAAAAVLLAVVAVGAVLATRGGDTTTTRAAEPTTTVPAPLAASSAADAASAPPMGDFPSLDALRAAASVYGANTPGLDAKARASAEGATSVAPTPAAPNACPTPPLDGGRVVGRAVASVTGAPVTVWIVEDGSGARDVIVIDDATCTVRSR